MAFDFEPAFHDLGPRKGPLRGFTIHMAEGGGTVGFLSRKNKHGVSVHYVIEDSGRIVQMLRENRMHSSIRIQNKDGSSAIRRSDDKNGFFGRRAAVAALGNAADVATSRGPNHSTLAVEIEGFAKAGPNDAQNVALVALVADIRSRHPGIALLGHRDFTATKLCPGPFIPWDRLGGHAKGGDMPGIETTLPAVPAVGTLTIPAGTPAIRVSTHGKILVSRTVRRAAYRMQLAGGLNGQGYFVDLDGDVTHFIRQEAPGVVFTEKT
jgi:hypothetical protein